MVHPPLVTELVDFHFSNIAPGNFQVGIHLHHYFQLDLILKGKTQVQFDGKKPLELESQEGLFIPPLVRHGYQSTAGYRQGMFKFHLSPYYWSFFGSQPKKFCFSSFISTAVATAGEQFNSGKKFARDQALATITLCLINHFEQIVETRSVLKKPNSLQVSLYQLLQEISEHPEQEWMIPVLARKCSVSSDHFSKCFRQLIGMSPQKYLTEVRMRKAAELLVSNPPVPIKEIAERCRYSDVHSFTKAFHKMFGISPGRYRDTPH